MALTDPVPSKALDVFERNTEDTDRFVTGESNTFVNRLGVERFTINGIIDAGENAVANVVSAGDAAIQALRVVNAGDFSTGFTLTARNEVAYFADDLTYYRWDGALPKTVPSSSTPTGTGGIAEGAWVDVGQAALRSDLAGGTASIDGYDAELFYRANTSNYEVTVGGAGDFTSINEALMHCLKLQQTMSVSTFTPFKTTVRLLTGYVLDEQILLENGIDMSAIEIVSDDATVFIDDTNMTRRPTLGIVSVSGVFTQFSAQLIFAGSNSKLPTIGCLFDAQGQGGNGVYVAYNSSVFIRPGCGVTNAGGLGLGAIHGCKVVAPGSNFSGAAVDGVSAFRMSEVDFRDGNADNAGARGMYCGSNSKIEALNATAANANDIGIEAYGGSIVHCRNIDVSGASQYGFYVRDGALISTRNATIDNIGNRAICCTNGGRVACEISSIANPGSSGIYAENGSTVSADGTSITGSGGRAIYCAGSDISIDSGTLTSDLGAVLATRGGKVACNDTSLTSSSGDDITVARGSIVSSNGSTVTANVSFNTVTADGIVFN